MVELLLGDEAVGLGAIHAGISGMFGYPGTPSTEIFEFVQRRTGRDGAISARWSANEKVAYEEALGMSFAGRRALVSMKHVGLNVAADPFMSSALTGANGGLVLAVANDPGMHSSQNEQDSRYYGQFAQIPVSEPASQQEAYDMTREAFELSERLRLPVMLRLVTRLAHSRSNVETAPVAEATPLERVTNWREWTLLPVNARPRFRHLLDLQPMLREHSEQSPHNRLSLSGPRGVIATGLANNYVLEALGETQRHSILKIGVYPPPVSLIRRLVDHCEDVLVAEEGYPFVEDQLRGLLGVPGKSIRGKRDGALPLDGELTADLLRTALGLQPAEARPTLPDLPGRPPQLCSGCPHGDTFKAMKEAVADGTRPYLFSDIGCYTLGALPPYSAIETCVDMGASISMAHGAAKAGAHPVLCTIGDSTFIHSGMTGLIGAATDDANMTVIILDNGTVAMTGAQEVFVTGEELLRVVRGLGVRDEHLHHFMPKPNRHDAFVELLRREINHKGLSVIVSHRPCIHLKRHDVGRPKKEKAAVS